MAKQKHKKSAWSGKGRFALAGSAAAAFAVSICVGLYFAGAFKFGGTDISAEMNQKAAEAAEQAAVAAPYFHAFPEMVVDLRTAHCRAPFLRFTLVVQIDKEAQPLIDAYEIRLTDSIQNHIRGYQRRELVGIEGANRIRADMVSIVNSVIGPDQVQAALFNNFTLH